MCEVNIFAILSHNEHWLTADPHCVKIFVGMMILGDANHLTVS